MIRHAVFTTMIALTAPFFSVSARASADAAPSCATETAAIDALIERAPVIALAVAQEDTALTSGEADLKDIQKRALEAGAPDRSIGGRLPVQQFKITQYLKGDGPEALTLVYSLAPEDAGLGAPAHDSDAFRMDNASGRSLLTQDCDVQTRFSPGETYLIFTGPAHVKGYEAIAADDDPWLAEVRRRLAAGTPDRP